MNRETNKRFYPAPPDASASRSGFQHDTGSKRGAPAGNQNARKHGYYSMVLDADEQQDFEQAVEVEGLDGEIALLRTKIKSVLRHDPQNMTLIMQAATTLARLLTARYNIAKEDKQGLKQAIANVLKDVALPLGISLGAFLDR